MSVIRKNADLLPGGLGSAGAGTASGPAADPFPDTRQSVVARSLVNMLKIPGEKQVLLKVRIAELKRSASRELGANFDFKLKEFMLASALAFLAWYVFAPQCASTLGVVKRETNSWRWPIIMFSYMIALAYAAAFITYRVAVALGAG